MSAKLVYFVLMLDNIKDLVGVATFVASVLCIAAIVFSIYASMNYKREVPENSGYASDWRYEDAIWHISLSKYIIDNLKIFRVLKLAVFCLVVLGIAQAATPNTKEAVTIYLVPALAGSKAIKKIPPLLEDYVEKELKMKIRDLTPRTQRT